MTYERTGVSVPDTLRTAERADTFRLNKEGIDNWVSLEPLRCCAWCSRLTPYKFHISIVMEPIITYRKCGKCLTENERQIIQDFFEVITRVGVKA